MSIIMPSLFSGHATNTDNSRAKNQWHGLVAAWKPSSSITGITTVRDVSGYDNHVALTSMTIDNWVVNGNPRSSGYVLDFNGSNNHGIVNDSKSLKLTTSGSISMWLYCRTRSGAETILCRGDTTALQTNPYTVGWDWTFPTKLRFAVGNGGGSQNILTTDDVPLNEWVHFIATWNNSNIVLYVNGVGDTPVTQTVTPYAKTTNLTIGSLTTTPEFLYDGLLDDIRIYDRTLSASQALDIYRDSNVMFTVRDRVVFGVSSGDKTVAPAAQALALAQPVPVIDITGSVIVTPSTQTLALTLETLTVDIISNVIITPSTQTLVLTQETPAVAISTDVIVTPSTQTLALTLETLTINTGIIVLPEALALVLAQPVPTLSIDISIVISGPLSLVLALPGVTISTPTAPPLSIRKEIVAAIIVQLKTITTVNGYNTEIGESVRDWQTTNIPIVDLPMIEVNDTGEVSEIRGQFHYNTLTIELIGKIATASIDDARNLQKDIIIAMVKRPVFPLNVYHFLPADKPELLPEKADKQVVSVTLNYEIKYREKLL